MKRQTTTLAAVLAIAAFGIAGCSTTSTSHSTTPVGSGQEMRSSRPTSGLVSLTTLMPNEASVGEEFSYEISAKASEGVANVVISDRVPEGAKYVRSEPTANVEGPNLIWRLDNMEPNETKTIRVWVQAEREGTLGSCA